MVLIWFVQFDPVVFGLDPHPKRPGSRPDPPGSRVHSEQTGSSWQRVRLGTITKVSAPGSMSVSRVDPTTISQSLNAIALWCCGIVVWIREASLLASRDCRATVNKTSTGNVCWAAVHGLYNLKDVKNQVDWRSLPRGEAKWKQSRLEWIVNFYSGLKKAVVLNVDFRDSVGSFREV